MNYEDRDEDFSSNENRRAEAYEQYERALIGVSPKDMLSFEEWLEMINKSNDRFETEQMALRDTH